jgi:hypothetical protein
MGLPTSHSYEWSGGADVLDDDGSDKEESLDIEYVRI